MQQLSKYMVLATRLGFAWDCAALPCPALVGWDGAVHSVDCFGTTVVIDSDYL